MVDVEKHLNFVGNYVKYIFLTLEKKSTKKYKMCCYN